MLLLGTNAENLEERRHPAPRRAGKQVDVGGRCCLFSHLPVTCWAGEQAYLPCVCPSAGHLPALSYVELPRRGR